MEGIGRERKIGSQIPPPLPLQIFLFFSRIFHCLQSSRELLSQTMVFLTVVRGEIFLK